MDYINNECPNSPDFEKIINSVRDTIYNLDSLIKLEESRNKYACLPDAGPVERAERVIAALGEPYTDLILKSRVKELENEQKDPVSDFGIDKDGIAHIVISHFDSEKTSIDLRKSLESNRRAKAFLIDLRNNPGGLKDEALKSISLFIKSGVLLKETRRATGKLEYENSNYILKSKRIEKVPQPELKSRYVRTSSLQLQAHPDLVDKPVVLLTNKNTASAAEIFAAALQDHKAAIVLGEKTRCKGIGQLYFTEMPEGSWLAVSNMRLYRPSGKWLGDVHKTCNGVEPDFSLHGSDTDPIDAAKNILAKLHKS